MSAMGDAMTPAVAMAKARTVGSVKRIVNEVSIAIFGWLKTVVVVVCESCVRKERGKERERWSLY